VPLKKRDRLQHSAEKTKETTKKLNKKYYEKNK